MKLGQQVHKLLNRDTRTRLQDGWKPLQGCFPSENGTLQGYEKTTNKYVRRSNGRSPFGNRPKIDLKASLQEQFYLKELL